MRKREREKRRSEHKNRETEKRANGKRKERRKKVFWTWTKSLDRGEQQEQQQMQSGEIVKERRKKMKKGTQCQLFFQGESWAHNVSSISFSVDILHSALEVSDWIIDLSKVSESLKVKEKQVEKHTQFKLNRNIDVRKKVLFFYLLVCCVYKIYFLFRRIK